MHQSFKISYVLVLAACFLFTALGVIYMPIYKAVGWQIAIMERGDEVRSWVPYQGNLVEFFEDQKYNKEYPENKKLIVRNVGELVGISVFLWLLEWLILSKIYRKFFN